MKQILFIIFIFFTSIIFAEELPFSVGEKFIYDVRLLNFKIGTQIYQIINKEIVNGKETYHFRYNIKSNSFFSKFYYLSEEINTWVETLLPVYITKEIDRKKYHKSYVFSIDHANQKATILSKHINATQQLKIPPLTLDFISLIYYLRNQNLKLGNSYDLNILTENGVKQIKVDIVKVEEVSTPCGEFMSLKAKQSDGDVSVWFTVDKRHIPVKIEIETEIGRVNAYLQKMGK